MGVYMALAVFLVTVGRLGDLFGRKRMFMLGLGVFTLGSLLCALSSSISIGGLSHTSILLAARALQGFGGSFMLPLSLAIITATFAGPERGTAIGIWGGSTGLATAIGTVERRLAGMASGITGLCRQVGMAVGIAFLGAMLTSRYNTYVHDRILSWQAPGLTPTLRQHFIHVAQGAGDLSGSAGLAGAGSQYTSLPLFPGLSHLARIAFVEGTIDILRIAAAVLAVGFLASVFLVRRADLRYEAQGTQPSVDGRSAGDLQERGMASHAG